MFNLCLFNCRETEKTYFCNLMLKPHGFIKKDFSNLTKNQIRNKIMFIHEIEIHFQ
jgi:hypothetical protein